MSTMASQITSLAVVYSTVYSGADQRKQQSSALLAFVRGIHRWPVNSPHKGPVTRKSLHLMMSSCIIQQWGASTWKLQEVWWDNVISIMLCEGSGTCFTKCLWVHNWNLVKIGFTSTNILMMQSSHSVAQITTWYVQNRNLIPPNFHTKASRVFKRLGVGVLKTYVCYYWNCER